jgi:hypothetical protein
MPGVLAPRWKERKTALDLEKLFEIAVEAATSALKSPATRGRHRFHLTGVYDLSAWTSRA